MPDRPGLDDHAELQRLMAAWADTGADLEGQLAGVLAEIERLALAATNPNRVRRLRIQARRLEGLRQIALSMVDSVATATETLLTDTPTMGQIYQAGAGLVDGFTYTGFHQGAVDILAQDLFDDVLAVTNHVDVSSKAWVRRVSRQLTGYKLTQGVPVRTQARRFVRSLRTEFTARGLAGITYSNGSLHSFAEYGEMLLRTKTGMAYNVGTLNASADAGITHVEILDGSLCGLTSHNDSQLANGLIVTLQTAADWPLAHPNCRRGFAPRPELNRANANTAVSLIDPASRADQAAFEAALRIQTAQTRPRRFVAA